MTVGAPTADPVAHQCGGANMQISSARIESILRREDLEGLLELGAPQDEYSSEALAMATALKTIEPIEDEVSKAVMNVWNRSFGPFTDEDIDKRRPVLQRIVQDILVE